MGTIRAEISGGKDRSVTPCPPSDAFYSAYIATLSISLIEILYDSIRACTQFVRVTKRESRGLFFFFFFPVNTVFTHDNQNHYRKIKKI